MKKFLLLFFISFSLLNVDAQFISEDFEAGIPAGWTLEGGWKYGTSAQLASADFSFGGNDTKFIGINDDAVGQGVATVGKAITDFMDFSAEPNVLIAFNILYYNANYGGGGQELFNLYYTEDGTTWNLITPITSFFLWDKFYFDLSPFVGGKNVKIAFEYNDGNNWNYGAGLDNVEVMAQPDYFAVAYPPATNYAQIDTKGEEVAFTVTAEYYGKNELSNYKLVYSIDGGAEQEILGTTNLVSNDMVQFEVPGFGLGDHTLTSKLVMNDNLEVLIEDATLAVFPPVPQFLKTDVDGVEHDLYADLMAGKNVLLDFFASWCGPCESSTPMINNVWESHERGSKDFQVYGITVERSDNDAVVRGLNWGGEYPAFGYGDQNQLFYTLFNAKYGTSSIPLFAMICPNLEDPAFSTISWTSIGFGASLEADIETAINSCVIEKPFDVNFLDESLVINTNTEESGDEYYFDLINTGTMTGDIFWKLEKPEFNHAWETTVCDGNICYPKNTDQSSANKPNVMNPGDTAKWSIHLYHNGTADTGKIILNLYSDSDFTNMVASLPITLNVEFINSTTEFADKGLTISPNPTSSYFHINTTSDISKVEVFNLIGKKVKSFDNLTSNKFNVSDLRNGVYLVRVFNKENNVLKVTRLNVNHLRP